MRQLSVRLAIAVALLFVAACNGEQEEPPAIGTHFPAEKHLADLPETTPLDLAMVYAQRTPWESSECVQLDEPTGHYLATFDSMFFVLRSNNPEPQYPVAEVAPSHPDYNGRWRSFTVVWTDAGIFAYDTTVPLLTSYRDIIAYEGLGHLEIRPGPPEGSGLPPYFTCKLEPWVPGIPGPERND